MERTEARRQGAKQAKQKKQDRRLFKQQAQKLFDLIDKYGQRPLRLHVWSDDFASNSSGVPKLDPDDGGGEKEVEKESDAKKKKGRQRKYLSPSEAPKKVHPRSKEAASPMHHDDNEQVPLCSMARFFLDKVVQTPKKGGSNIHDQEVEPLKTLASVVKEMTVLKKTMTAAKVAIHGDATETSPDTMELLNYSYVEASEIQQSEETYASLSDSLIQQLNQNEVNLGKIVYVAADDKLIFDRYRDGVFMNERDMLMALGGHDELGRRRISVGSESEAQETLHKLPGSILELTLSFLPDSAVAACVCVCKHWNNEIGRASPNLWQQLLARRKWPLPRDQSVFAVRKMFIDHYTTVRNVNAIRLAMTALTTRRVQPEIEMCYQDFSSRKQAPSEGNECVAIQIWSETRMLVAYGMDCSLRLFEAAPKLSQEKLCKEIVYQRLDPYKNTKRRRCTLLDMALDDECIGSLCQVKNDGKTQHILIVVNREEFLLCDSSAQMDKGGQPEELDLNIIDISEATINYVLTSETADHRQLQLLDFIQDGGELTDIEVLASERMVSCGSGRFMVEVSISIPLRDDADDDNDDNGDDSMRLIERKLVLFSASVGAIVWVGDGCYPSSTILPRDRPMTLVGHRTILPGDYRPTCTFVVASPESPSLLVGSIDPSGTVKNPSLLSGSSIVPNKMLTDEWQLVPVRHRLVVLGNDYAIAADQLEKAIGEGVFEKKTVISFLPLHQQDEGLGYRSMELSSMIVLRMVMFGEDHLCLVCREFGDFIQVDAADGVQRMTMAPQTTCIMIIHIPSCHEIYRADAGMEQVVNTSLPAPILSSNTNISTIGCALGWSGVSITGDDVRRAHVSNEKGEQAKEKNKKKKKASKPGDAKGRKKDGFARGMSSRG